MSILRLILKYCLQIKETRQEFNNDKERYDESATFRNAVCLCLLQIGELVGNLSDEFKEANSNIHWRSIKKLRNIVAHRYKTIDFNLVWVISMREVPDLAVFCKSFLTEQE